MLMNLKTRNWDNNMCRVFGIPEAVLPTIKSNSEVYGKVSEGVLKDVPISGCVGDQQAALLGQLCTEKGTIKNTYGTGCFSLLNTGTEIVHSKAGLLTTVAFQLGKDAPLQYALEGSVAVAGSAVQWLRDNLKLINSSAEINEFASKVKDTGGMYFVPAFSGLLSPYWRSDARGVAVGMTFYTTKEHLCRALLEATCYQTKEVLEAMIRDADLHISCLKVDGGMAASDVMLQFQADILNLDVARSTLESTGLGAAFAAGLAVGFWDSLDELRTFESKKQVTVFSSSMDENRRASLYRGWKKAVERSFDLVEPEKLSQNTDSKPRSRL
jgi:glycerol kinase